MGDSGEELERLVRFTIDGDAQSLQEMLQRFSSDQVRRFINQRSPVNGRTLLHIACLHGHKEIVKYFIQQTDCDLMRCTLMGRMTPLHFAAANGHRSVAFQLLTNGAQVNSCDRFGNTALHYATTANIAKLLLEFGASVNALNQNKDTALDTAKQRETSPKDLVKFLDEESVREYLQLQARLRKARLKKRRQAVAKIKNQYYN